MDQIQEKIEALRAKYPEPEDQKLLSDWEKTAKQAAVTANLGESDAMKIILTQYHKEIEKLNKILLTDKSLFKDEEGRALGLLIHERRSWYQSFINMFEIARSTVEGISKTLDKSLKDEE